MTEANFRSFQQYKYQKIMTYLVPYYHLWPSCSFLVSKHNAVSVTRNNYYLLLTKYTNSETKLQELHRKNCLNSDTIFQDHNGQNAGILHDFSVPMSNFRIFWDPWETVNSDNQATLPFPCQQCHLRALCLLLRRSSH